MEAYIGLDIGSISTKIAIINRGHEVINSVYIFTQCNPINATKKALSIISRNISNNIEIKGCGVTGSARRIVGLLVGADLVKNEIISHGIASLHFIPNVKTIIEIGGQEAKLIIIKNGIITDFAMNTICAAGTGAFLEYQAQRLGITIEEFGDLALQSKKDVKIAGRCTVFAESDVIYKSQIGISIEDIVMGLCKAVTINYLNDICRNKEIELPIVFQGGVAANKGVKKAFEEILNTKIIVPKYYNIMGAIGAAILAKEIVDNNLTKFKGFNVVDISFYTTSFICFDCPNECEIIEVFYDKKIVDRYGGRCKKWELT